jgi:hypothetical protein
MGIIKRSNIGIILAALSFLIYVCTVFALPQQRDNAFICERLPLLTAVSNIIYGGPLGTVYSGALERYLATSDSPIRQVLVEWPSDGQGGNRVEVGPDGNGVGYVLGTVMRQGAVMALFGIGFVAAVVLSAPDYVKSGRLSSVLWHRVVVSLSASPDWPFGDVAQRYDCRRRLPAPRGDERRLRPSWTGRADTVFVDSTNGSWVGSGDALPYRKKAAPRPSRGRSDGKRSGAATAGGG